VETGKSSTGAAVFAKRRFWPGDYVLKFGGEILDRSMVTRPDYTLTIGTNRYLSPSGEPDDLANHSCDPNTQVLVRDLGGGHAVLSAIKVISLGDEITFDYGATLEKDDPWTMKCRCGSLLCRGVIGNPTEGSLYRSPLRLAEELQGGEKRSWDLGYHHAIRTGKPNDRRAADKEAYAKGFASGQREQPHPTKNTWTRMGRRGGYLYNKDRMRTISPDTRSQVVDVLRSKGINLGGKLGSGGFGEVFKTDDPGKVLKLDLSGTEHRLVKHVMARPELSRLPTLPKFYGAIDTGVVDATNGAKVHAIHREDVHDIKSYGLTDGLTRYGKDLDGIADAVANGGMGRQDALQALDDVYKERRETSFHPDHHAQFDQVHQDVRALVSSGIVPCDLRGDNWGQRHNQDGTSNVVMRDVGCFSIARESGPYQLDTLRDAHRENPRDQGALASYLDVLHTTYPDHVNTSRGKHIDDMSWVKKTGHDPVYFMTPDHSSIGKFLRRSEESSHFIKQLTRGVAPGADFHHDPVANQSAASIQLGHEQSGKAALLVNLIKHHYPGSRPQLSSDDSGHRIDIDNLSKLRARGERLARTHRRR